MFSIYMVTGPSGKSYVGLSKNVSARWRSHIRRASENRGRHPFYDAIRSYGAGRFTLCLISEHLFLADAQAAEIALIAMLQTTDRRYGYNVSPGGEYDALIGPKIFWDRMRADPEALAVYRANLRAGQALMLARTGGSERAKGFLAFRAGLSARERYRRSWRALRMAGTRVKPVPSGWRCATGPRSAALLASIVNRQNVTEVWANRGQKERQEIALKISQTLKRRVAEDVTFAKAQRDRMLTARASGDVAQRAAGASRGLKQFWADLRSDPVRYQTYIDARRQTLKATNRKKKDA